MIGVIADVADRDVAREFFELFKTPWEFFREGRPYDVLLCAGDYTVDASAKLVIVYAGRKTDADFEGKVQIIRERLAPATLSYGADRIPIYGSTITFGRKTRCLLSEKESGECAAYIEDTGGASRARIGFDLFGEVRTLLTAGQPVANASIPALELQIAFLRELITGCGISLVEIPPVPDGFQFVACLTHDVDHPSIRQHKWDHTMFGFVYRATVGSLRKLIGGEISFRALSRNWFAVLKLPFVYLGIAKDFWREFADRYQLLEQGFRSTFFIIPYKQRPGTTSDGPAPSFRASGYGAEDIADILRKLRSNGYEVGLHGIDAWADSSKGREELQEIQRLTGIAEMGVRMHWLFYDQNTPETLEKAGALYDSTFGYNENVGYRAGTTQVYKPLQTAQLLELPLHVMDTALFYPSRLELSQKQASALLQEIQDNAVRFGGVLTVNWHDRSLAPERLWDEPYRNLLANMKNRKAWFATAGQAVAWFRKRRSATFEVDPADPETVRVRIPSEQADNLPALRIRTYKKRSTSGDETQQPSNFVETTFDEGRQSAVISGAN